MLALSAWMGLCTYLMGGRRLEQYWMMSGFASAIIAVDAGLNVVDSFEAVILRLQQTLLGLITHTLVFVLLWPNDGYASFKAISSKLSATQQKLFRIYLVLMHGGSDYEDKTQAALKLKMQAIQLQTQFVMLLKGIEKKRYQVWEIREKWAAFKNQMTGLSDALAYWRESFAETKTLDLQTLLPDLEAFSRETDGRLTQLNGMLADKAPTRQPQSIELTPDADALKTLSPFDKAAFTVFFNRLRSLEPLTHSMFYTLGDIKDFTPEVAPVAESAPTGFMLRPSPIACTNCLAREATYRQNAWFRKHRHRNYKKASAHGKSGCRRPFNSCRLIRQPAKVQNFMPC
jgi:hypothetical protein